MNFRTENQPQTLAFECTIEASFAQLESCVRSLNKIAPVQTASQLLSICSEVAPVSRRLILNELIKCDMNASARQGAFRPLEFYRDVYRECFPYDHFPFDLVLEEIQLRRELGSGAEMAEYQARFPEMAATIGRLWESDQATARLSDRSDLPDLSVGERIDDFRLQAILGEGAFARVFLAFQESMHRLVALKISRKGSDEPQALSQLDHPNIVRVYDQRVSIDPPAHLLYMQYLAGGTIADLIARVGPFPIDQRRGECVLESVDSALASAGQPAAEDSVNRNTLRQLDWDGVVAWLGSQLAQGLDYAHARGVLHRDIKPANILLSSSAVPQLADFNVSFSGLAGRAGAAAYFGGSLAYMSPEQLEVADPQGSIRAEELDGRSDIFSLGMVLWELWQGCRPWTSSGAVGSWTEAVALQLAARRSPLARVQGTEQPSRRILAKALSAALACDRNDRPQNGAALANWLRIALFPQAAALLEPKSSSWHNRLRHWPVLLIASVLVFVPNAIFGVINYDYNMHAIVEKYSPELQVTFRQLAWIINGVFFPIGAGLLILFARPVKQAINNAQAGRKIHEHQMRAIWLLGHRSALIGGVMWSVAGTLFPLVLTMCDPNFSRLDALHFLASHAVCGGVAWICPFFGLTLTAVSVYYPYLLSLSYDRNGVCDPGFSQRRSMLENVTRWYLVSSAAIPLLALVMLVLRADAQRYELLLTICCTAIALMTAFAAHRHLERTLRSLKDLQM